MPAVRTKPLVIRRQGEVVVVGRAPGDHGAEIEAAEADFDSHRRLTDRQRDGLLIAIAQRLGVLSGE